MPPNSLIPKSAWPRATLLLVTLESIIGLVLVSLVLQEHILRIEQPRAGNSLSTPNVIYPILYLMAIVSLFTLCVDAMYHRNQIQVVAFTFFNFLCFSYGIIQTINDWHAVGSGGPLKAYNVATTVTMGVCTVFLVYATCKLSKVFGWEMYRFLGADLRMRSNYCGQLLILQRCIAYLAKARESLWSNLFFVPDNSLEMHKGYEILITLLKFDVFFFVAYAIQMFTLVDTTDKRVIATFKDGTTLARQQLLIGLAMPASIILLVLAFFGVRRENRIATIIVMVCLAAAEPYFIYQLVYLHLPQNKDRFINSVKYLTFFIAVTMVLVLMTLFNMVYCFRNFGKGLLISQKSKVSIKKRPFEIDEDPTEAVPSMPVESKHGDDGATQNLMAYPALKKIQETYHIPPTTSGESSRTNSSSQGAPPHRVERSYDDKMEIE